VARGLSLARPCGAAVAIAFPFCNDGQAATIKLVNLLKHSVYFRLDDQPTFIGEIDHSLLVPPFGAPGPEPNKARDRDQRSNRQKQCPWQQKPVHFSSYASCCCHAFRATRQKWQAENIVNISWGGD
jgi:hypothetical protein